MISFRFHVVSLTAVFLAIAVGVVVGTTYVDRAVVEGLEDRIDTVSENLDERRAQIAALEDQVEALEGYATASTDYAVTGQLAELPVLVLAARGVDEGSVEQLATLVRHAGAVSPGVVWLEGSWALDDEGGRRRLAELLGSDSDRTSGALVADALTALLGSLAAPPAVDAAADPAPPTGDPAFLAALVEAGFLSVDDLGDGATALTDLAGTEARLLLVTGTEADAGPARVLPALARRVVDGGRTVTVADVYAARDDDPGRGVRLWEALDEETRDQMVVVDAVDRPEGRVAAVLGVAEAVAGRPGRYGYGPGATSVLPPWTAP